MERNSQIRRAVRQTLVMSAVATAATLPAQAQEADEVDTIVVTGSRIRSANLEGTSPVTQVTAEDIATAGVTRVEDLVTQLPQAFAAQNSTVSNGATGAATVSLRNLGDARTLVLVDGKRMPYGSTTSSAADLNQIPSAMVERVEILTGGSYLDLMRRWKRPVYYDQQGQLVEKFGIRHVPALVSQEGKRLRIDEIL